MSAVLNLDRYKELFKDDASLKQFAQVLENAGREDVMKFVLYHESLLVALISVDEGQDKLRARILRRIGEAPEVLDRLRASLEEDIVE